MRSLRLRGEKWSMPARFASFALVDLCALFALCALRALCTLCAPFTRLASFSLFARLGLLALFAPLAGPLAHAEPLGAFSSEAGLTPWSATYLPSVKQHTRFTLVEDGGQRVLRIDAEASAGTLVLAVPPALRQATTLRWRWKVPAHNPGTDPLLKKGDDYPVRIYVLFDYDIGRLGFMDRTKLRIARRLYGDQVPAAALSYVWDPKLARDRIVKNAFTDRVRMVVARSGSQDLGLWVDEQRDLRRDFQLAFDEPAPAILGIAIAGDADNTGKGSIAFVGDLSLE